MAERMIVQGEQVLIADDDPNFLSALETIVRSWGYEVLSVRHGMDAWQILLREDCPRLMILDWIMPGMDGLEICRRVRSQKRDRYTYIILITVQDELEHLTEGLTAGADDYLTKPIFPNELEARLLAGQRILDLQAELISSREALRLQATRDPLTCLWNRQGILDVMNQELSRTARNEHPMSVIMLDVDHFKHTNDTYGHLVGDKVLKEIGMRVKDAIRIYDSVGRYGGDEFLVVLPDCDIEFALQIGERIRKKVIQKEFSVEEISLPITVSMGVAASSMGIGLTEDDLIWAADEALLRAKQFGRDRVEYRHPFPRTLMM